MKKILIFSLVTLSLSFVSCKKDTQVGADLKWNDVSYFELTSGWKASLYNEAISFLHDEDYNKAAVETKNIKVNDEAVIFNQSISQYENFTLVIFNDKNENGKYDHAEVAKVKFSGTDAGENLTFDITVDY